MTASSTLRSKAAHEILTTEDLALATEALVGEELLAVTALDTRLVPAAFEDIVDVLVKYWTVTAGAISAVGEVGVGGELRGG